jgi:hypothetical protein
MARYHKNRRDSAHVRTARRKRKSRQKLQAYRGPVRLRATGKYLRTLACVVADAVLVEPVSSPIFPTNREKNRGFCRIDSLCAISKADTQIDSKTFSQIPYATEQGIISGETGNSGARTGNITCQNRHHGRMKFSVHTGDRNCSAPDPQD